MKRNQNSLRDLWDNINHISICIIGVPEWGERERERAWENIWRETAENFPNLGKETVAKVQEVQSPIQD